jgi:dienelactone hydrolase
MSSRSMNEDDPLEDFARHEITLDGVTKRVYVAGSGPAVIVMSEMPGISPYVARFARWVRDAGFTYMPSLFGRDGACRVTRKAWKSSGGRVSAANSALWRLTSQAR